MILTTAKWMILQTGMLPVILMAGLTGCQTYQRPPDTIPTVSPGAGLTGTQTTVDQSSINGGMAGGPAIMPQTSPSQRPAPEEVRPTVNMTRLSQIKVAVLTDETITAPDGNAHKTSYVAKRLRGAMATYDMRVFRQDLAKRFSRDPSVYREFANQTGGALIVYANATSAPVNQAGPFMKYRAMMDFVVLRSFDGEIIAEDRVTEYGERNQNAQLAAESALEAATNKALGTISSELTRQADEALWALIEVDRVLTHSQAVEILDKLEAQPGVKFVSMTWNQQTYTSLYEVVYAAAAQNDLGYNLENLFGTKVRIESDQPGGINAERKLPIGF